MGYRLYFGQRMGIYILIDIAAYVFMIGVLYLEGNFPVVTGYDESVLNFSLGIYAVGVSSIPVINEIIIKIIDVISFRKLK